MKLDNTDQIVYSVSSAGTNLVHIKDVVQLADGSIMMLANFYGTGIELKGRTYTGKVDICNNALIPYSSTLPIQKQAKNRLSVKVFQNEVTRVYPNPTYDHLVIEMMCKAKCIVSYQLIDASGKLMDKGIYRRCRG